MQILVILKKFWHQIPTRGRRVVGLQLSVLSMFAVLSLAIANVIADQGQVRTQFATPALQTLSPWHEDVQAYGSRLHSAFGIGEETATEFADWILEASIRQDLEPDLIASLIFTESTFRKYVRSYVGAVGPTQVRPDLWSDFCVTSDLTDPEQNVFCGSQILAHLREVCGNNVCALKAYNIGLNGSRQNAALRYVSKVDTQLARLAALPL
jgi:hypothetical protein